MSVQHTAAEPATPPRRRWRRRWLDILVFVAPALISAALRVLAKTVRIRYVNGDEVFGRWARGERLILAFWHNRLVMMPIAVAGRGRRLCIMNSQSRDGEIATRAVARWGIRSVRGSATRGGAGGFMQLVNAYRRGDDLAVVPDGPRGPRYIVKRGVIHLARATGAPIIPVTYAATRAWQLRSWDRLIIPRPFARVVYVVGEPLRVPRHADEGEVEGLRVALEARLNAITHTAEAEMRQASEPRP
ncbi:MAG TPA: lysophospholipid acyltransferase family protein [Candidatus Acidoferrales bacterium]|nr:lysophospholipid acyltransferase family protein [Candidatus Acidoferrales bacterium]